MLYIGNGQLPQYLLMVAVSLPLVLPLLTWFGYEDEVEATASANKLKLLKQKKKLSQQPLQNETLVTPIVGDVALLLMSMTQSSQVELWDKVLL